MNAKRKIFATILMVVLLCSVLNACSTGFAQLGNFNDVYQSGYTQDKMPDQLEEIAALAGYTMEATSGNLGLFSKDAGMLGKNYLVYNFNNQAVVKQKTIALADSGDATLTLVQGQLVEKTGDTYTLYDQLGNVLTANSDRYGTTQNLILLGNTVYRIDTETYAKAEEIPFGRLCGDLPSFDDTVGGYYYRLADESLMVFNHKLEYVAGYTAPLNAKEFKYFALSNGNLILQYRIDVDGTDAEYDVMKEGSKYRLKTFLLDVQTGLTTEKPMNGAIAFFSRRDADAEMRYFQDKISQVALVLEIADHAFTDMTAYAVADDGVLEATLNPLGDLYDAINPLVSGYFSAARGGRTYLLSGNGSCLGDISGMKGYNQSMLATDHEVYDYHLERIVSVEDTEGEMHYQTATPELMFFANDDGKVISVSSSGAKTVVADGKETFFTEVIGGGLFGIRVAGAAGGADTYRYYDSKGKALLSDAAAPAEYTKINQAEILSVTDADGTVRYYRLSVSGTNAAEVTKSNKK